LHHIICRKASSFIHADDGSRHIAHSMYR